MPEAEDTRPTVAPAVPAMPAAGRDVGSLLDAARQELLDFSLRNNLLNYRPSKARTVEIVGENSAEVFRLLVREGKAFTFQAAVEAEQGALLSGELALEAEAADCVLQTTYSEKSLHARLLAAYYAHRTYIEERGVNILFIALGMLRWHEDDASEKELRAPLLLVPVTLERSSARDRFKVRYGDDEIQENLSLAAKLKSEFAIEYPGLPELEDLNLQDYFNRIADAVSGQPGWRVAADEVTLSFFSFGKFLMYRDLDVAVWPEDKNPSEHKILNAALVTGFREPVAAIGDDENIDAHVSPERLNTVVDADSSQVLAILDVSNGRNLVIQGPPGTGKSQTITNVIAQGVAEGKRILFVAEKMAALDVVKRRLSRIGLGDICLELHSNNAHKRTVLNELRRTLELGGPNTEDRATIYSRFQDTRQRLNSYCAEVNTPIANSGITPSNAFGRRLTLKEELSNVATPRGELFEPSTEKRLEMLRWSKGDYARKATAVSNLSKQIARMGVPRDHPLRGCQLRIALDSDISRIRTGLAQSIEAIEVLRVEMSGLSGFLNLSTAHSAVGIELLVGYAKRVLESPDLIGVNVRARDWQLKRNDLRQQLDAGSSYAALRAQFDQILIPIAWQQDVVESRGDLQTYGEKWWRLLSGRFRRARARVAGLCKGKAPVSQIDRLAILDAILQAADAKREIEKLEHFSALLFGSRWQGVGSTWRDLANIASWLAALHADIEAKRLPVGILEVLANGCDKQVLAKIVTRTESALTRHKTSWSSVFDQLAFDQAITRERLSALDLDQQRAIAESLAENLHRIPEQIAYNNLATAVKSENEEWILPAADEWEPAGVHLARFYENEWLETLIRHALQERRELREFNLDAHEQAVGEFASLDALLMKLSQGHVLNGHWQGLPSLSGSGQLGLLAREFEKRSRHLPIRQLVARAGHAMQQIKPVFMMSPLSIASYIPPGTIDFDLVVFDEASQVPPVDAFGAILRGAQAVVVGDSKQLPPTRFFDSYSDDGTVREDDEEEVATADMESVLGLFCGQGAPQRMLRWHYRSQHESLIAVSNKEFYDSRLVVFPSPQSERGDVGLIFRHLPGAYYERGGSRSNPGEAEAVAAAVLEHARKCPHLTLGVAAFSIAQMDAIQTQLEAKRRADPACEQFLSAHSHEPFFVKNLETVQGDERDVIMISIGYGRDKEGYLTQGFGALNRDGGERRLNVLVTRARRRCEVFSSITDEDIDIGRSRGRGVAALHTFLKYARTGILDSPIATGREPDSDFEIAVANALRRHGHTIEMQVGSGGFFVDLGVRDPEFPGRYILGVECDGATYHRARSARDRDRLRQQVLESLGWQLHRIWSTDWFANPDRELKRALERIADAKSRRDETSSADPISREAASTAQEPAVPRGTSKPLAIEQSELPKYQYAEIDAQLQGEEIHRVDVRILANWIVQVVDVESPVHQEEVFRRVVQSVGVQRIGNRVEKALWRAVEWAVRQSSIRVDGLFLWHALSNDPLVRDRSDFPPQSRRLELVSPQEIGKAIELVVEKALGIAKSDVAPATCRLLGFLRVTDDMRRQVDEVLGALVGAGTLRRSGDQIVLPRER